jgi:hypothetical protein
MLLRYSYSLTLFKVRIHEEGHLYTADCSANIPDCLHEESQVLLSNKVYNFKVYMSQSLYGTKFIRHKVYTAQSLYITKVIRHKVYTSQSS